MKTKSFTFKNVTLNFKFNKDSKYYLDGDNVIQLDNDWMHRQCFNIWDTLVNKRTKVIQDYDNVLNAISDNEFSRYKQSQDAWVESSLKKYNVKPTGATTILNRLINLK